VLVADAAGMARSLRGPAAFFRAHFITPADAMPHHHQPSRGLLRRSDQEHRFEPRKRSEDGDIQRDKRARRCAFTLIEAIVALTVATMAGAMILLAVDATLDTTGNSVDETIAIGMAKQLIDEVTSTRYVAPSSPTNYHQYPLTSSSWEAAGNGRERFNDSDDYNNFVSTGAEDIWGFPMGEGDDNGGLRHPAMRCWPGSFSDWRQEIQVYYVDGADFTTKLAPYVTSDYHAVEVIISRRQSDGSYRELARLKRVFTYVPRH